MTSTPVPATEQSWLNGALHDLDLLDEALRVQTENGLHTLSQSSDLCENARKNLTELHVELRKSPPDIAKASELYLQAQQQFNDALCKAPLAWRWVYLYGLPNALYMVLSALVIACLFERTDSDSTFVLGVPTWVLLFGAAGAVLQSLSNLLFHVNRQKFRKIWLAEVLASPVIGALSGVAAYLIVKGGFAAVSGSSTSQSESVDANLVTSLVSFAAGYKWSMVFTFLNNFNLSASGSR